MGFALKKEAMCYTYSDYLTWTGDERYELIDGDAYLMSPAPSTRHQVVIRTLFLLLNKYFADKPCEVFFAPFDVRFPLQGEMDEDVTTVLQPDIVVICDKAKLDDKGCQGAPDLVVEIASPSSFFRDIKVKKDVYERAGVLEYWVVDSANSVVWVFILRDGVYEKPMLYAGDDKFNCGMFPELEVALAELFA